LRSRLTTLLLSLALLNGAAWMWALVAFHHYPLLLGTALLAYGLGLRHAVDADHIAAIDNVTRKLMQDGQRPVGVGLFFSLGHSTVVIGLSMLLAVTMTLLQTRFESLKAVGGVVGTGVSAAFLLIIAAANAVILVSVYRSFRRVVAGGAYVEEDLDLLLSQRGLLGRLFRRLFRLIGASWHMYPLGMLFGLGFDTATEVGLLGISATQASQGLAVWSILVFPALFTAGMALVDSLDSVLMLGAYRWAFTKPVRKLYYNLTVTAISVLVALLVGGLETLGLLADRLALDGPFWTAVTRLTDDFGLIGSLIIGLFLASWLVSALVYRARGYDALGDTVG
jgi:high-affinity nickel-transport protein